VTKGKMFVLILCWLCYHLDSGAIISTFVLTWSV
jgi:hypothetical protein